MHMVPEREWTSVSCSLHGDFWWVKEIVCKESKALSGRRVLTCFFCCSCWLWLCRYDITCLCWNCCLTSSGVLPKMFLFCGVIDNDCSRIVHSYSLGMNAVLFRWWLSFATSKESVTQPTDSVSSENTIKQCVYDCFRMSMNVKFVLKCTKWNYARLVCCQSEAALMQGIVPEKHQRRIFDQLIQSGLDLVVKEGEVRHYVCMQFIDHFKSSAKTDL